MRKKIAFLMVVGLIVMAFSAMSITVSAEYVGDVTILADGTVSPVDAPIHVKKMKYSLTDDILGSITIQKSAITLCGEGYTLEGSGGGDGILAIGLTDITIKDFNVKNFHNGIVLMNCDDCTIKENTVTGCIDGGIYLSGCDGNTIKENKLHDNLWEGIWLEESNNNIIKDNEAWNQDQAGIFLWYWCDNNLIKDNYVHHNGYQNYGAGILLVLYCDNNMITKNKASDENTVAIALNMECNDNMITKNTIRRNLLGGIYVYTGSTGNTIKENTIFKNYAFGQCGIRFVVAGDNTASHNKISHYYRGILVIRNPAGTSNLITENTVRNNYKGIQLSFESYDNQIHHNNFISNDIQAQDFGIGNLFDDGSEGNYWSDYKGKDKDKDGIGDTAYSIDGLAGSMDNCPLMNPWEW
jgi:nitrous oxidase accessory protein